MRLALLGLIAAVACSPKPAPAPAPAEPTDDARAPADPPPADPPPAEPPETSAEAPPAEQQATSPDASAVAVVPAAPLLGRPRADVTAALGRPSGERDGWVVHGEVAARYRGDRCVGLQRQVPQDMDCQTAVESLGFRPVGFPLRRGDGCEWPGISDRHRLAPGVAARYDAASRTIEVWLRN